MKNTIKHLQKSFTLQKRPSVDPIRPMNCLINDCMYTVCTERLKEGRFTDYNNVLSLQTGTSWKTW